MNNGIRPLLPPARARQLAPLALVLISAIAGVAAYLQALNYPFISDDATYITENTKLAGLHFTELWRLFVEQYNTFDEFLPLRELSYWLDMTLFGLNPSAFRMHNIILYLLSLPLVYAATSGLWRYFRPEDMGSAPWAAAAVTALFAVHPALVESVVWISGRKYVLPNVFSMLALWCAVSARREHGFSPAYATATLVAFAAMMFSKASYVAVAPVIALLWFFFWCDIPVQERRRSLLLWPLAILLLAAAMVAIFIASSSISTGKVEVPFYFGIKAVIRTLAVQGWLARLAISPENRHFFYPVLEDPWLPAMAVLGMTVLAAAVWGAAMILRKRSLECFALVAFALLCLPYLQLVPYAPPSLVSDRFLSLSMWPALLLIVALAWRLKPVPRTLILLAIALPLIFQTIERPRDWRSEDVLIGTYLRAYPGHYMPAFQEIMAIYLPQGLYGEASDLANKILDVEARNTIIGLTQADYAVHIRAVSAGNPQEAMSRLWNLGIKLKQPPDRAKWNAPMRVIWMESQRKLASLWGDLAMKFPGEVSVRYNAGLWMVDAKRYEEAVVYLRSAVKSQYLPESVRGTALMNLGFALVKTGHIAEAETSLRAALEQPQPDKRTYCLLSEVYRQATRFEEAAHAETNCPRHTQGN